MRLSLQAENLWKLFKWALDWRGRYDSLAATYHEVGGGGVVIGYILDPPPWVYPASFVAGFVLIWWNFHRNREQANVTIEPPPAIVAPIDATPRGNGLITLGQACIFGAFILAAIGLLLIVIGDQKNRAQYEGLVDGVVEAAKKVQRTMDTAVETNAPSKPTAEVPSSPSSPASSPPPAPAPAPAPSPPQALPEKPSKQFVDPNVTPEFLVGLYEGQTDLGAEWRTSKYIGKWIQVSGPLLDTVGGFHFMQGRTPVVATLSRERPPSILMVFHDEWLDRLAMFSKNQNISVSGQIREIGRAKVVLDPVNLWVLIRRPTPRRNL
jgi:hypothetical protein